MITILKQIVAKNQAGQMVVIDLLVEPQQIHAVRAAPRQGVKVTW